MRKNMAHLRNTVKQLKEENARLLKELETAYKHLEVVVEQSNHEKEIAYRELQNNFEALERMYQELSKKENLLVHLEKLSSIGQFITEIVHELKNPLTIISAHTEMALMLEPSPEVKDELRQISKQVMQMSGYLQRFRSMAYKGQGSFQVFDLNHNIDESVSTIEIIKPGRVEIILDLCRVPLYIKGDPYQTNQIFLNLAKNAFDAMKKQGNQLLIRSRSVTREWCYEEGNVGKYFCLSELMWEKILQNTSKFALVEFEDNGEGIPEENQKKIFQAFFTTKERGQGTGLGLSISSDIAKRHNGNMAVLSQPGKGTTFQLFLPLVDEEKQNEAEVLELEQELAVGNLETN